MVITLQAVMIIAVLVMAICKLIVLYAMFKEESATLAIFSIFLSLCFGGIGTIVVFIAGWIYADDWEIRRLMQIFTVSFAIALIAGFAAYGMQ